MLLFLRGNSHTRGNEWKFSITMAYFWGAVWRGKGGLGVAVGQLQDERWLGAFRVLFNGNDWLAYA